MYSNKRRATLDGLTWNASLRGMPFLRAAALFFTNVRSVHCAQNALPHIKNGDSVTAKTCINKAPA